MSEILQPSAIVSEKLPTLKALEDASLEVRTMLEDLAKHGDLVSASSFGSFAADDGELTRTRVSDLDWIMIFADTNCMHNNSIFGQCLDSLAAKHVPFHNPVLSLENVKRKNHMIGSLLYGIERSPKRLIIGQDPVQLFAQNGVFPHDRSIAAKTFSTLPRYLLEHTCVATSRRQMEADHIAPVLQSAIMYFRDVYRTMFVLQILKEDPHSPLLPSFDGYALLHRNIVDKDCIEIGMGLHAFQLEYRDRITLLLEEYERTGNTELVRNYGEWLKTQKGILANSAKFCQENMNRFYDASFGPDSPDSQ